MDDARRAAAAPHKSASIVVGGETVEAKSSWPTGTSEKGGRAVRGGDLVSFFMLG